MALKLTKADRIAIEKNDIEYLNRKGEDALFDENYEDAIEYYRLTAALGSDEAYLNLGYCYLYGRGTAKNESLAIAYFKMAADFDVIEALYKLGSFYGSGAESIERDKEVSLYYYDKAVEQIIDKDDEPSEYPDLYYSYAQELMKGDDSEYDLGEAFDYLLTAHEGYAERIEAGVNTYQEVYDEVEKLLDSPRFAEIRSIYEDLAESEDDYDYDGECGCGHRH